MSEQSMFARSKEVIIWGILHGLQREQMDFRISYLVDVERERVETVLFRWAWRNTPTLCVDHLTGTLRFNSVPQDVRVDFKDVVAIAPDGGMPIGFPVEAAPAVAPEPEVKRPNLKLVN